MYTAGMFRIVPLFVCLLLSGQSEPPTFRANTQVVEFTVVAVDKKGQPVADLKREDFTLLDAGKPREIAFFRYEGGADPAGAKVALPPHVFSNRLEMGGSGVRDVTAILIDSSNTAIEDQMAVKAHAVKFLKALAPQTMVAIFQMGREFRVLHDFTDDLSSLRAGLDKLKVEFQAGMPMDSALEARQATMFFDALEARHRGARGPGQEAERSLVFSRMQFNSTVQADRVDRSMRLLESLGTHLASIPGRKSLVWVTGGLGASLGRPGLNTQFIGPGTAERLEKGTRVTSQRLAQAGVALYALDAGALSAPGPSTRMGAPGYGFSQDTRAVFELMTATTGGRYFLNTGDFAEAIKKSQSDARGTYLVGFYAQGEPDGKWRSLKATVARPGVILLHRKGYQVDPASALGAEWGAEQWQVAMRNPLGSAAIRLNAYCARVTGEAGSVQLTLQVDGEDVLFRQGVAPDRREAELEVAIGEKTTDGRLRMQQQVIRLTLSEQQIATVLEKGIPYRKQWKPGAETAVVRVLVRDKATGRLGALDVRYD
ncbi:MAG: VWA domain-containing protein [Bryobacterales bacterium]|nr:VWA domain-containing protein [Bryobacterales bacterium]